MSQVDQAAWALQDEKPESEELQQQGSSTGALMSILADVEASDADAVALSSKRKRATWDVEEYMEVLDNLASEHGEEEVAMRKQRVPRGKWGFFNYVNCLLSSTTRRSDESKEQFRRRVHLVAKQTWKAHSLVAEEAPTWRLIVFFGGSTCTAGSYIIYLYSIHTHY